MAALAYATLASEAHAQAPTAPFGTAQQTWTIGAAPPPVSYSVAPSTTTSASDLEVASLYALAAGYGVGTGIWLDAELSNRRPRLAIPSPAILGVAAPVGVFLLDRPRMPRGMPAAIATGMALGAGEGIGIASYQYVRSQAGDQWGFRGFARSVFIGSTVGIGAGYAAAVFMEPSPKTSLLLGSSVLWGTAVGSMFGYGGSKADSAFGDANDSASLGGLIGYNTGMLGAAALSTVWVPSYQSLTWMWIGFGAGLGVSLPVYLFYAGGDHDPRRGLILQGTAGNPGATRGSHFHDGYQRRCERRRDGFVWANPKAPVQVTGGGLMPIPGEWDFQISGLLF